MLQGAKQRAGGGHAGVYLTFNQDCTCICTAHGDGIRVYSLDGGRTVFTAPLGAVRSVEMLFSTSLLAYVGAGEQPKLTPRKVSLLNSTTHSVIQDLSFPASVLAVRMNRKRLVAVLEQKAFVHDLESLKLLSTIDTPPNPQGLCALTTCSDPSLLALPARPDAGTLRVYDALEGGSVVAEVCAHKSRAAALAWNHSGTLLASASDKGTVLRVHALPQAAKVHTFRRGTSQARIHCLAFSGEGVSPPLLAAASSHGTVHVWLLSAPAPAPHHSLLAAVIPPSMTDMVDPVRSATSLRLPAGVPSICAIQSRRAAAASAVLDGGSASLSASEEEFSRTALLVATAGGVLYTYHVTHDQRAAGLAFVLEDEQHLFADGGA